MLFGVVAEQNSDKVQQFHGKNLIDSDNLRKLNK